MNAEIRQGKPNTDGLVWEQINSWVWVSVCGKFKIERFIISDHELLGTGFVWPERFRVLRHTPEWYFEHPTEPTLAAAKEACELESRRMK